MKISLSTMAAMMLVAAAPALAKPLACPSTTPSSWGLANAKLESVRVLSHPTNEKIDDAGPLPIMAPDNEAEHGGKLLQSWHMNVDAPGYVYKFDCLFSGTKRFLRIEAPTVKLCTATSSEVNKSFRFQCN
jgi:hypothetical protein